MLIFITFLDYCYIGDFKENQGHQLAAGGKKGERTDGKVAVGGLGGKEVPKPPRLPPWGDERGDRYNSAFSQATKARQTRMSKNLITPTWC
jgi:hypothetical protein